MCTLHISGSTQTNTIMLHVILFSCYVNNVFAELPVEIKTPPQDVTCMEKDKATFTCELTKPNKQVKWLKNGQEIPVSLTFWLECQEFPINLSNSLVRMDKNFLITTLVTL